MQIIERKGQQKDYSVTNRSSRNNQQATSQEFINSPQSNPADSGDNNLKGLGNNAKIPNPLRRSVVKVYFLITLSYFLVRFLISTPLNLLGKVGEKDLCRLPGGECYEVFGHLLWFSLISMILVPIIIYLGYVLHSKKLGINASVFSKRFLKFFIGNVLTIGVVFSIISGVVGVIDQEQRTEGKTEKSEYLNGKEVYASVLEVVQVGQFENEDDKIKYSRNAKLRPLVGTKRVHVIYRTKDYRLSLIFYTQNPSWLEDGKCYMYNHKIFKDDVQLTQNIAPRVNNNRLSETECTWEPKLIESTQQPNESETLLTTEEGFSEAVVSPTIVPTSMHLPTPQANSDFLSFDEIKALSPDMVWTSAIDVEKEVEFVHKSKKYTKLLTGQRSYSSQIDIDIVDYVGKMHDDLVDLGWVAASINDEYPINMMGYVKEEGGVMRYLQFEQVECEKEGNTCLNPNAGHTIFYGDVFE